MIFPNIGWQPMPHKEAAAGRLSPSLQRGKERLPYNGWPALSLPSGNPVVVGQALRLPTHLSDRAVPPVLQLRQCGCEQARASGRGGSTGFKNFCVSYFCGGEAGRQVC